MLENLSNIILKEIKELLRDPKILIGMILVPSLTLPVMGFFMNIAVSSTEESLKNISVLIVDFDQGPVAQNFASFLDSVPGVKAIKLNVSNIQEAVDYMLQTNNTNLIVIPPDFSNQILNGNYASLETYTVFQGKGIAEQASSSVIVSLIDAFKKSLVPDPFQINQQTVIKGKIVHVSPGVIFSSQMAQFMGIPIGMTMLIMFSMQIAATSIASEKEEKTLEMLLTMPIDRLTILTGKLTSSILIAIAGSIAYILGANYYMSSFMFGLPLEGVDLSELGLTPTPFGYFLIGISLFVSMLSALALAATISIFAEDVRSAQTLIGYLYMPILIPMILLMFTDLSVLPLPVRIVLLAIPYTHPILSAKVVTIGDYLTIIGGIAYVTVFTIVLLYIAAKVFSTEKILTAKIQLRKIRRKT